MVRYGLRPLTAQSSNLKHLLNIARMAAQSVEAAQNMVVVKTLPGLAKAMRSFVDKLEPQDLAGSIAGNDTILVIMKNNEAAAGFAQVIQDLLSGKRGLS